MDDLNVAAMRESEERETSTVWGDYGDWKGKNGRLIPLNYTLKLDFDGPETAFIENIKRVRTVLHIAGFLNLDDVIVRQTQKGFHTYLKISSKKTQLIPGDIVTLQCLLGSDYKREAFNFLRVKSGVNLLGNVWNVLFTEKHKTSNGERLSQETERPDLKPLFYAP
jgi:hypothetical protein